MGLCLVGVLVIHPVWDVVNKSLVDEASQNLWILELSLEIEIRNELLWKIFVSWKCNLQLCLLFEMKQLENEMKLGLLWK